MLRPIAEIENDIQNQMNNVRVELDQAQAHLNDSKGIVAQAQSHLNNANKIVAQIKHLEDEHYAANEHAEIDANVPLPTGNGNPAGNGRPRLFTKIERNDRAGELERKIPEIQSVLRQKSD